MKVQFLYAFLLLIFAIVPAYGQDQKALDQSKSYSNIAVHQFPGVAFDLKTKYQDGAVSYVLSARPYSPELRKALAESERLYKLHRDKSSKAEDLRLILSVMDKDDFRLWGVAVRLQDMGPLYDDRQRIVGIAYRSMYGSPLPETTYMRFTRWGLRLIECC